MAIAEHEAVSVERDRYREALKELAGDYGCTVITPPDEHLPPIGDPCRDKRPDDPDEWCYACWASAYLEEQCPRI
jgi:hypothetical protein